MSAGTRPALLNGHGKEDHVLSLQQQPQQSLWAERALREAIEGFLPGGITTVDRDGRQTHVSASFCKMVGWEPAELLGARPPFVYWPPEDVRQIDAALRAEMTGPSPDGVKLRFRRKDRERFDVVVRLTPLGAAEHGSDGWLVLVDEADAPRGHVLPTGSQREAEEEHSRVLRDRAQLADHMGVLLESTAEGIYGVDQQGRCTFINRAAAKMLGFSPGELLGQKLHPVIHHSRSDGSPYAEEDCELCPAGQVGPACLKGREVLWRRDRTSFSVEYASHPIVEGENRRGAVVTFVDVTEREQLEEQVRQSQKMEAVGRLAGGVAHDFNNLLTIITGYTELMLDALHSSDPLRESAREVQRAAERAAALTQQLLLFSRKQVILPELLDINAAIADTEKMLQRLIGEDIECATMLGPSAGHVKADRGQFQQILLNLAVNARDAMPQGGRLAIETTVIDLDTTYTRTRPDVRAGAYVLLTVSDTGCGMTEEVQAHLFEPFFTTKELGKGTGLGLSTVYGIVKSAGGHIEATSAVGRGTTFRVYLPRVGGPTSSSHVDRAPARPRRGRGTVLVVEDEDSVRRLIVMILRWNGYTLLEARQCSEAVALCKEHVGDIDLLVTDVIMPQMNGHELAEHLLRLRANMKVLYISGYTGGALGDLGGLEERTNFLHKPFSPDVLARKVSEVLEQ